MSSSVEPAPPQVVSLPAQVRHGKVTEILLLVTSPPIRITSCHTLRITAEAGKEFYLWWHRLMEMACYEPFAFLWRYRYWSALADWTWNVLFLHGKCFDSQQVRYAADYCLRTGIKQHCWSWIWKWGCGICSAQSSLHCVREAHMEKVLRCFCTHCPGLLSNSSFVAPFAVLILVCRVNGWLPQINSVSGTLEAKEMIFAFFFQNSSHLIVMGLNS